MVAGARPTAMVALWLLDTHAGTSATEAHCGCMSMQSVALTRWAALLIPDILASCFEVPWLTFDTVPPLIYILHYILFASIAYTFNVVWGGVILLGSYWMRCPHPNAYVCNWSFSHAWMYHVTILLTLFLQTRALLWAVNAAVSTVGWKIIDETPTNTKNPRKNTIVQRVSLLCTFWLLALLWGLSDKKTVGGPIAAVWAIVIGSIGSLFIHRLFARRMGRRVGRIALIVGLAIAQGGIAVHEGGWGHTELLNAAQWITISYLSVALLLTNVKRHSFLWKNVACMTAILTTLLHSLAAVLHIDDPKREHCATGTDCTFYLDALRIGISTVHAFAATGLLLQHVNLF